MSLKDTFLKHSKRVGHHGKVHLYKRPYLAPILGVVLAALVVLGITVLHNPKHPDTNSHVVFLFDDGRRQTLDATSTTVGELVKNLPLKLQPEDVVEPSLDTPIVQDNFRINIYRSRPVTVIDNGVKTVTVTAQKSPRVVASAAGLTVYPEDKATFAQGDVSSNTIGEQVMVDRAVPIQFALYGTNVTVRTRAQTVADLLKEKKVILTKDDTLTPALETPITPGMTVTVIRNGTQVATVEEPIDPPTQYVDDPNLTLGATALRQPGAPGKKAVTYQVVTENGVVTSRTPIQTTIIQDPVPQIMAKGTMVYVNGDHGSLMAAAGISSADFGYADFIIGRESGWRPGAQNASGAYGLCQALPGSKMASAGADWASNPITQLRWCDGYAQRYGGWAGAYSFWVSHHYW